MDNLYPSAIRWALIWVFVLGFVVYGFLVVGRAWYKAEGEEKRELAYHLKAMAKGLIPLAILIAIVLLFT